MVSATNGKTTTCAMIASILEARGARVVHNMTGANLRSGLATTLLYGDRRPDVLLLETDEATLPRTAPDIAPDVLVLGNLFRDQLDRYGELDSIATAWRQMLSRLNPVRTTVVYNADDPLIATMVSDWTAHHAAHGVRTTCIAYGMADPSAGSPSLSHAADSKFCARCSTPLHYSVSWIGHLGDWSCSACANVRPALDVSASTIQLDGLAASTFCIAAGEAASTQRADVKLRIPGLYNVYNAIGASAACTAIAIPVQDVASGLASSSPAFGRFERIPVPGNGTVTLLLVKNPAGLNEVIRTLVASGVDLTALLFALNDGIADGTDTSWIWDADIEPLVHAAPSGIIATGDRAAEFALRCMYAGADVAAVHMIEDIEEALFTVLERGASLTQHGHCYALVTYTAMLRMRELMTRQGWAPAYWERRDTHVTSARPTTQVRP